MNKALQVLPIEDIHPYKNNPRINDGAVASVRESIRQCGYVAPIIVDEAHVILAGHTRYKAILDLGWAECECMVVSGLSKDEKRKYRLLDNKTAELAMWDFDALAVELDGLDFDGFDFGFDIIENEPFDENGLDAEESENERYYCKFGFDNYKQYSLYENELKTMASRMGALFSVDKK